MLSQPREGRYGTLMSGERIPNARKFKRKAVDRGAGLHRIDAF